MSRDYNKGPAAASVYSTNIFVFISLKIEGNGGRYPNLGSVGWNFDLITGRTVYTDIFLLIIYAGSQLRLNFLLGTVVSESNRCSFFNGYYEILKMKCFISAVYFM